MPKQAIWVNVPNSIFRPNRNKPKLIRNHLEIVTIDTQAWTLLVTWAKLWVAIKSGGGFFFIEGGEIDFSLTRQKAILLFLMIHECFFSRIRYFYAELHGPARNTRTPEPDKIPDPVTQTTNGIFDPKNIHMTRKFRICSKICQLIAIASFGSKLEVVPRRAYPNSTQPKPDPNPIRI